MRLPVTKYAMSLTNCWLKEKIWWDYLSKMHNLTHRLVTGERWWNCLSQNLQHRSQTVGHRCNDTAFHKMCNVTHRLLVIGKYVMRGLAQHVPCHSQTVCHRKSCDETIFHKVCIECHSQAVCNETVSHKVCNVTHKLFVVGKDVMRVPFTTCAILLTSCWSWETIWWYYPSPNVIVTHSLLIIWTDVMRFPSTKIFNVAYILSVMGKMYMEQLSDIFALLLTYCWP